MKLNFKNNFPVFLALVLYILIYLLRWQQGAWEPRLDLFPQFRNYLDQRITSYLPKPQAQLLSGIVLGEKKDLPADLRLALRDTSTLHIVVVSGQNLSLLAGFFLSLSGLIKKKTAIVISLLAITFYTLLTGAQVPVLRAAVMVSLTFLAQMTGRQRDSVWVLVVTAGGMLLVNPSWITDLSFQLSFMATLGVVVVSPILLNFFKHLPLIGQDLSTTLGAQLLVTPIIAQNFHQISLVSIITNILILWTIPFIMILGAALLTVSFFSQLLSQVLAVGLGVLLTYFIYIVKFFSNLPFAWEYVGEKVWIFWLGYYLLMLAGVLFMLSLNDDRQSLSSSKTENS